jgi:hypothetical protein
LKLVTYGFPNATVYTSCADSTISRPTELCATKRIVLGNIVCGGLFLKF